MRGDDYDSPERSLPASRSIHLAVASRSESGKAHPSNSGTKLSFAGLVVVRIGRFQYAVGERRAGGAQYPYATQQAARSR